MPDNKQIKILVHCLDDSVDTTNPQLISLNKIDTSKVTTFERAFFNTAFNEDISEWIISKGKTFQGRFNKSCEFRKSHRHEWDTQSATNMIAMFHFATNFNNSRAEFGKKWIRWNGLRKCFGVRRNLTQKKVLLDLTLFVLFVKFCKFQRKF